MWETISVWGVKLEAFCKYALSCLTMRANVWSALVKIAPGITNGLRENCVGATIEDGVAKSK